MASGWSKLLALMQSQRAAEKSAQQRDARAEGVPALERTAAEAKREAMRCRASQLRSDQRGRLLQVREP